VQRFKMTLMMLGPVHIGSGHVLSPLDYIVRQDKDGVIWFYAIDTARMFGALTDRQRSDLDSATKTGNPAVGMRRFITSIFDPARHAIWQCQADDQLLKAWQQQGGDNRSSGGREQRNGPREGPRERPAEPPSVLAMTRTGQKNDPYLPGSSIKGAIRTAWLWYRSGAGQAMPGLQAQAGQLRGDIFEAEVLGYRVQLGTPEQGIDMTDPHADPLRSLRVTDAALVPDSNVIERVVIYEGDGKSSSREPMFVDATFSGLEGEPIYATGALSIHRQLQTHAVPDGLRSESGRRWRWPKAVAEEITADQILEACRQFYLENLQKEFERFYKNSRYLRPIGEKLLGMAQQLRPNEALLRVGRFSHLENMTVRPYAGGTGRTRGLAGALRPMGWTKMRLETAK
jgi:CRISPR type III-A-associated RAMP protein Csm5